MVAALEVGDSRAAKVSSIPTKYETLFNDPRIFQENDGFTRRTHRFSENYNNYPGPGKYLKGQSLEKQTPSVSTRGLGSFASHSARFRVDAKTRYKMIIPGPGSYNAKPELTDVLSVRPAAVSSFKSLSRPVSRQGAGDLGPGSYEPVLPDGDWVDASGGVFRSKVKRFKPVKPKYERKEIPLSEQICKETKAYRKWERKQKKINKRQDPVFRSRVERMVSVEDEEAGPGPGSYADEVKPLFPKPVAMSSCFKAPGRLARPLTAPSPGPGHYERLDRRRRSSFGSVAFKSNVKRMKALQTVISMDPGLYNPLLVPEKYTFRVGNKDFVL